MKNKKIVVAGGTGFIGTEIAKHFCDTNEVIILTRLSSENTNRAVDSTSEINSPGRVKYVEWDGKHAGSWTKELEAADLVINLSGKSVNCRYTTKNKEAILNSRLNSTAALGKAIQNSINPAKLWINASSATIYRHAEDKPQDELNGEIGDDFSMGVCKNWEKVFFEQRTPFTRKIALRMAITLGPTSAVMTPYFNLLKFGLGGCQGSGKQMYSWVHIDDTIRIIDWLMEKKELEGVVNCCSPNPVTNNEFMRILRKTCVTKIGLPAFSWMLSLGAFFLGTEKELVLKSRWVIPGRLLQSGFMFKFPLINDALKDIIDKTPDNKYQLF